MAEVKSLENSVISPTKKTATKNLRDLPIGLSVGQVLDVMLRQQHGFNPSGKDGKPIGDADLPKRARERLKEEFPQ